MIAPNPVTGAEDFSFVLEQVPGAFVFLGACPPDADPATAAVQPLARGACSTTACCPTAPPRYAELAMRRLAAGLSGGLRARTRRRRSGSWRCR